MYLYQDRQDAGSDLAQLIMEAGIDSPVILALPRGGVPVASVISHELGIPFDVLVTRRIGSVGAIAEDGRAFLTEDLNYADPRILEVINEAKAELRKKISLYRGRTGLPEVEGRSVILVDDNLYDGISVMTAAKFLKGKGARRVYLAVPVAPLERIHHLDQYVDEVLCPHRVSSERAKGPWYQDFVHVTDREVLELLGRDENLPRSEFTLSI